jgi:hypothetical protein
MELLVAEKGAELAAGVWFSREEVEDLVSDTMMTL